MEGENKNNNGNGNCLEKRVENILIGKTKFWISVIAFALPIIGFFFKIQLDIALIKQNHEAHMEKALEEIKDLNEKYVELKEEQKGLLEEGKIDHDAIIKLLQMHAE